MTPVDAARGMTTASKIRVDKGRDMRSGRCCVRKVDWHDEAEPGLLSGEPARLDHIVKDNAVRLSRDFDGLITKPSKSLGKDGDSSSRHHLGHRHRANRKDQEAHTIVHLDWHSTFSLEAFLFTSGLDFRQVVRGRIPLTVFTKNLVGSEFMTSRLVRLAFNLEVDETRPFSLYDFFRRFLDVPDCFGFFSLSLSKLTLRSVQILYCVLQFIFHFEPLLACY